MHISIMSWLIGWSRVGLGCVDRSRVGLGSVGSWLVRVLVRRGLVRGCLICRGRISWGLVGSNRVMGLAVLCGVSGGGVGLVVVTIVRDISDISGVAIDVIVNVLAAAVGENDIVVSLGVVTIAGLVLAHVDVVVVVLHGVIEAVVSGGLAIEKELCYFDYKNVRFCIDSIPNSLHGSWNKRAWSRQGQSTKAYCKRQNSWACCSHKCWRRQQLRQPG